MPDTSQRLGTRDWGITRRVLKTISFLIKKYWGNKIKDDEMGGICSTLQKAKKYTHDIRQR
jgi:hypothetical protein